MAKRMNVNHLIRRVLEGRSPDDLITEAAGEQLYVLWRSGRGTKGSDWYVTHRPGQNGVDWGYGTAGQARPQTEYWMRRFMADMARVGYTGHSRPATEFDMKESEDSPEGTPPEDETPGSPTPGAPPKQGSPAGTPDPEGQGWGGAKVRKYVMGSYAKERGVSPAGSPGATPSPRTSPSPAGSPQGSPEESPEDGQVEWREDALSELRELFHRRGLKTRVLAVPIESFDFIQGALESDDRRHQNLAHAIEAGQPIPPLLSTPSGGGRQRVLDGHHRILATVQRLRPPYPRMRTIEVRYPDGRPFSWKDGELGKQLFSAVPGYRRRVAERTTGAGDPVGTAARMAKHGAWKRRGGGAVIVCRDPSKPTQWRAQVFTEDGLPVQPHYPAPTKEEAVQLAFELGADLNAPVTESMRELMVGLLEARKPKKPGPAWASGTIGGDPRQSPTFYPTREAAEKVAATAQKNDPDWKYKVEPGVGMWAGKFSIKMFDETGEFVGYWPPA